MSGVRLKGNIAKKFPEVEELVHEEWIDCQKGNFVGHKLGVSHSPRREKVLRMADAWSSTISRCRAFVTNLISMSAEF